MGSFLSEKSLSGLDNIKGDLLADAMDPKNKAALNSLMASTKTKNAAVIAAAAALPPTPAPTPAATPGLAPAAVTPAATPVTGGAKKKLRMKKRGTRSTRRKAKKAKGTRRSR